MSIPTFFLPFHWGKGDSWTPSHPGPHLPTLPPLELAELPTRHLHAWLGERHSSQSCHLPPAQHSTQIWSSFQQNTQPKAQESSLFGERRGQGGAWEPGSQTHLLSVAVGSLEVAEERPGLSDHRQQGRRLLEDQQEEARARDDDSDTERDRVRGRKKEKFQC